MALPGHCVPTNLGMTKQQQRFAKKRKLALKAKIIKLGQMQLAAEAYLLSDILLLKCNDNIDPQPPNLSFPHP